MNAGPITTDGEHHPSNVFDPANVFDIVDDMREAFRLNSQWSPLQAVLESLSVLEILPAFYEQSSPEDVLRLSQQMKESLQFSLHNLQVFVLVHKDEINDDLVEAMNKHICACLHQVSQAFKMVSDAYSLKEMPEDSAQPFEMVNDYEMNKENIVQWLCREFVLYMERNGLLIDSVGNGENAKNIIVEQKKGTYRYYDSLENPNHPKPDLFNNIKFFVHGPLNDYLKDRYGDDYTRLTLGKNAIFRDVVSWFSTVGVGDLKAVFRLPHVISLNTEVALEDGSTVHEPGLIVLCHKSDYKKPSYPRIFNRNYEPINEDDYYEYDIPKNFSSRWFLKGESISTTLNQVAEHLSEGGYFVPTSSQSFGWSDTSETGDSSLPEVVDELANQRHISMDQIWDSEQDDEAAINFRDTIEFTCKSLLQAVHQMNPQIRHFFNIFITQKYGAKIELDVKKPFEVNSEYEGDEYPWWELACVIAFGMGMNLAPTLYQPRGESTLREYFKMTQFASYIWGLPRTGKSIVQMLGLETFKQEQIHYTDNQKSKTFNGLDKEHLVSAMVDNQNEGNGNTGLANSFALPLISKEPVRHESKFQQPSFAVFRGRFFGVGNATLEKSSAMSRRLIVMQFNNQVPPEVIQSTLKENLRSVLPLITWLSMTLFSWIDHVFGKASGADPLNFLPQRFKNDMKDYDNSDTLSFFLSTEFEMGGSLKDDTWVPLSEPVSGRTTLKAMYATWNQQYGDIVATLKKVDFTEDAVKAYCTNKSTLCSNLSPAEKEKEHIKSKKPICVLRRCKKAQVVDLS